VGQETRPAQHLLESIGFQYLQEVDPFDGGPHYGANVPDITIVKNGKWAKMAQNDRPHFTGTALVGFKRDGEFRAVSSAYGTQDGQLVLPRVAMSALGAEPDEQVYFSEI
jgi:arginine N-succinyltransferase